MSNLFLRSPSAHCAPGRTPGLRTGREAGRVGSAEDGTPAVGRARMRGVSDIERRLAAYLAPRIAGARNVAVSGLDRIHGGASRETSRFVLRYEQDGRPLERRLILRRDPPGSLIETDRRVEFAAYRAFHGTAVPVPEALWLEEDPAPLDYPFFVMEEMTGFESSVQALLAPPYLAAPREDRPAQVDDPRRDREGRRRRSSAWSGCLAPVAPDACWRRELAHWESVLDEDELEPQPVIRAVDPLAAPESAAAGAEGRRRARGLPHRELPVRRGGRDPRDPRLGDGAPRRSARRPRVGPRGGLAVVARRPRGKPAAEGARPSGSGRPRAASPRSRAPCSGGSSSRA